MWTGEHQPTGGAGPGVPSAIQRLVDMVSGYFVPAVALSKATMPNIREYLVFAWIYNSAGIPVAAGVPYSFVGLLLSPMIAAAAMALSSL